MGSERYDRAVTVFAPDGHLLQVEYAQQATRKGSTVVGVRGTDVVVLGVERKAVPALQVERTVRKIFLLDEHVAFSFSGLTADARILVNRAQVECQSHRLTVEVPATLLYITRFLATLMQKYTQSNGRRPFGISCLLGGFDADGTSRLYQIEPTGIYCEWKAAATGRAAETVRKFLEDNYKEDTAGTEGGAVTLAIRALLEVVHSDVNNFDIAVIRRGQPVTILDKEISRKYLQIIEQAKEDECEKQKPKRRREC